MYLYIFKVLVYLYFKYQRAYIHAVPGKRAESGLELLLHVIPVSGEEFLEWLRNSLTDLLILIQHQLQMTLVTLEAGLLLHDGNSSIWNLDPKPGQPLGFVDQFQHSVLIIRNNVISILNGYSHAYTFCKLKKILKF